MDPSRNEVLAHYGYSMEELRKEGEVGTGIWNKEEAFVRLGSLPDFMKFVDSTKKPGSYLNTTRTTRRHCLSHERIWRCEDTRFSHSDSRRFKYRRGQAERQGGE